MATKYNCEKNGKKYYRKTITIGHKSDGTAIRKEFYGNGEKDCDKKIEEFLEKMKSGLNVSAEKLTVEECMHYWLFEVLINSKNLKSSTFEKHETNFRNYIKGSPIAYVQIQNAVSNPFQIYYNELYKNGLDMLDTRTNTMKHIDVSSEKIFDLNKTLRSFFTYCIKQKYTTENPCSLTNIEIPGNADGCEDDADDEEMDIQVFNDEEINKLKEALAYSDGNNNTLNVAILLDLVTGLRLGELLGLKKKFITNNTIKVRNTLKRVKIYESDTKWHRELRLIRPKFKSSIRTINFPENFNSILQKYFLEQELKWKRCGLTFDDESPIFTSSTCNLLDPKNFADSWKRLLRNNNIDCKKFHSIRDTYATTLIRRGANIHDIKDLLGHSSIKITEKYYIFVLPEDKSKTANLISDIVNF